MAITAAQIRAARGLLDWTREDLAREAGLSSRTIRNLEKGFISPRGATASGLCSAFDKAGVVFPPEGGVRQERPEVKTIEGRESVDVLFESLLGTVKKRGGEVLGIFGSRDALLQAFGIEKSEAERRLVMLERYAHLRFLFSDLDQGIQSPLHGETRTISRYCVGPEARLVYDNKHVLIYNIGQSDHRTIIINDARIASATKGHFCDLWGISSQDFPAIKPNEERPRASAAR